MSDNRLRILQLLTVDSLAGTELMTCNTVRQMAHARLDVDVGFLLNDGPLSRVLAVSGVTVRKFNRGSSWVQPLRIAIDLARTRPPYDVAHIYGFKTSLIGRLAFKILSPSTIVVDGIRGLHLTQAVEVRGIGARLAILVERVLSPLIDYYVTNSHGALELLTQSGLPEHKFTHIPSGIDTGNWQSTRRQPRPIPIIACVARLVPIKRHADLIEALDRLSKQGVQFKCVLGGDGPLMNSIRSRVDDLGLTDRVSIRGELTRSQVRDLLAEADVFVLVSDWEGLPGSVMEAMASGLPVVGTNVNGINELVRHGETGLLVPARDVAGIEQALRALLEHPAMRIEMGQAGRRRVEHNFDIRSATRALETFYDKVAVDRRAAK